MSKLDDIRAKAARETNKKQPPATDAKSSYINNIELTGNIGRDVQFRATTSGKEILSNSLAVWQPGKDAPTMWLELTLWVDEDNQPTVDVFLECEKGSAVIVEGRLTMREYKDKQYWGVLVRNITLDETRKKTHDDDGDLNPF